MEDYAALLFSDASRAAQAEAGVLERFDKVYPRRHRGPLDSDTRTFLETRDSIYIASTGKDGWPYVQHRGGPVGFVKVLGDAQIGFADYAGNQQFVTQGNLVTDRRVALFAMDYPRKARLKLLGHARMMPSDKAPELAAQLAVSGQGPVERLVVIDIAAMDWNCPKYITPRYTEDEINRMLGPRIAALHSENEALKARLMALEGGET